MEIQVDPFILLSPTNSVVRLRERAGINREVDITLSAISLFNLFTIINGQGITTGGRPIIHKVLINTLTKIGSSIEKVVIDDIVNGKFHSHIYITNGEQVHSIDAHAPDSIGLAVMQNCPLFILEDIFKKAAEYQATQPIEISDEEAMRIFENFDMDKAPKN